MRIAIDIVECGGGLGAGTCAYIGMDAEGAFCLRNTSLASTIVDRVATGKMSAKRLPILPYPDCISET